MFKLKDIEEKLEKIERNEQRLDALCSRFDNLENLNSKFNTNDSELEVVLSQQPNEPTVNSQQQQV